MANRAGRKRKTGVKRQPNGQPARSAIQQADEAQATVIDARRRFYRLSRDSAKDPLAGYAIGRMALAGCFGKDYGPAISAVQDYCSAVADYMRLKLPLHPIPKAMNYFAARGASLVEEPSNRQVRKAEERYSKLCDKLAKADGIERMHFHNAAFHDIEPPIHARASVVMCISLLHS